MGHFKTISLKILFNGLPILLILILMGKLNWLTAIAVSLVLTIIAYVIGDVLLLPAVGNYPAALADGGLAFLVLYFLKYWGVLVNNGTIILSVIAVFIVEGLIYHPYLKRLVSQDSMGPEIGSRK